MSHLVDVPMVRPSGSKLPKKRMMQRPLSFHLAAREMVADLLRRNNGPVSVKGLRLVNVVVHVAIKSGPPSPFVGFSRRFKRDEHRNGLHIPKQSRRAVNVKGGKPSTMLVFTEDPLGNGELEPASTIVAGASSVPSAIETVLQQWSRFPDETIAVFNSVVTARISAPGFTLDRLRAHPQAIFTPKFPGAFTAHFFCRA